MALTMEMEGDERMELLGNGLYCEKQDVTREYEIENRLQMKSKKVFTKIHWSIL